MSVATTPVAGSVAVPRNRRTLRPGRMALHAFLITMAAVWLWPLLWAVYTAFRTFGDTQHNGYVSLPETLTLQNFFDAWTQGDLLRNYTQTLAIVIPGVIVTLLLASMIAFGVTKFSWRFNLVC